MKQILLALFSAWLFLLSSASSNAQFKQVATLPNTGVPVSGDFNNDGLPDIAVAGQDSEIKIYRNLGHNEYVLAASVQITVAPVTLRTADMNGDGKLDLIVDNSENENIDVYYGDGKFGFTYGASVLTNGCSWFEVGDVNNDGKVDIYDSGTGEIFLNQGNDNFEWTQDAAVGFGGRAQLVDVTGDGFLDVMVSTEKGFDIFKGNGKGGFSSASHYDPGLYCINTSVCSQGAAFVLGDFYGNGLLNIATLREACEGQNCYYNVTLYKNTGKGTFTKGASTLFHNTDGYYMVTVDLNNDQKPDLYIFNGRNVSPHAFGLMGDGAGHFTIGGSYLSPPNSAPIIVRDMSLDSKQDLIDIASGHTVLLLNETPRINCVPPSSARLSAKICSPLATQKSGTFTVRASGNSPAGVQRMELWIDGVKKSQSFTDQLSKSATVSAGKHRIAVVAVDQFAGKAQSSVSITVP